MILYNKAFTSPDYTWVKANILIVHTTYGHMYCIQTFTAELTEGTIELSAAINKSGEGIHVCLTTTTSDWSFLTVINQQQLLLQRINTNTIAYGGF